MKEKRQDINVISNVFGKRHSSRDDGKYSLGIVAYNILNSRMQNIHILGKIHTKYMAIFIKSCKAIIQVSGYGFKAAFSI